MALSRGARWVTLSSGAKLSCDIGGWFDPDTSPLVLLPSVGGGAELWGEFRRRLEPHVGTIALDPPGFGRSSPEPRWPSIRGFARESLEALDRLGIERFSLFGISFGALVAQELALAAGARLEGLVLASAVARGLDFSPRRFARAMRMAGSVLLGDEPKAELAEQVVSAIAPPLIKAEAEASAALHPWSRAKILRFLTAALRHAPGPALREIRAETLLLWGECDPLIGPHGRGRLQRALPYAQASVVARVGHDLVLEAPLASAEQVRSFLLGELQSGVHALRA